MVKNCTEILRLSALGLSQEKISSCCRVSKSTVSKVLKAAKDNNIAWPLKPGTTDASLSNSLFPEPEAEDFVSTRELPNYALIRESLKETGMTKKILWKRDVNACQAKGTSPLMYSRFCDYIRFGESQNSATMHVNRFPGERVEVDWAGTPAHLTDPISGEKTKAFIFVAVLTYSKYAYVEAFLDEKMSSWIIAHVHMFDFFGGVAKFLVPDNCATAVNRTTKRGEPSVNATYQELAEHYGTIITPARVRKPKDKGSVEGCVGVVTSHIIAALRDQVFTTLSELNSAIRVKLEEMNHAPFQKKDGCRYDLYAKEEVAALLPLPPKPFEMATWSQHTVNYDYHITCEYMHYSVPYTYIGKTVSVKMTASCVEIFYENSSIAKHARLHGSKGQYSTHPDDMPQNHQHALWDGDRFRRWAAEIGESTVAVVDAILGSRKIEQQAYKSCFGLLKLREKYSESRLEAACAEALRYSISPSYKLVKNILVTTAEDSALNPQDELDAEIRYNNKYAHTRGAAYYGRKDPNGDSDGRTEE